MSLLLKFQIYWRKIINKETDFLKYRRIDINKCLSRCCYCILLATVCSKFKHVYFFSNHEEFYDFLCSRSTGRTSTTPAARCASTTARCKTWTLSTIMTSLEITPIRIFRPATPVWTLRRSPSVANCCSWVPVLNRVPEYPVSIVKFTLEVFDFTFDLPNVNRF